MGLHIMSYRASMIGGSLEVRARRAAAARSSLPFPCRRDRRASVTHDDDGVRPVKKHGVFVVDDHPIVRQGLALLINREPDLMVCGEAEEASGRARGASRTLQPDMLVLDISLAGRTASTCSRRIRSTDAALPMLVLSMHDEAIYAERALRAGANGYIMKQEATEKVLVGDPADPRRRRVRQRAHGQQLLQQMVRGPGTAAPDAGREPERPRARSVPADRRGPGNPPDRRGRCT